MIPSRGYTERKLTAVECRTIKGPGFYRADDTLYLYVKPSGRRSWVQRVMIDGRRANIGLGSYPVISLKMARERAFDNRRAIALGRNPLLEKRRAKTPTFKVAALETHAALAPTFKSEQHTRDWIRILTKHAIPKLGNIPVDRITPQDVLKVLKPIWTVKAETARRVRQRIRTVLDHCRASGYVLDNVAGDTIKAALPTMPKIQDHHRALDYRDSPDAVKRIQGVESLPARLGMLFLIHTAVRSNDARGATWAEIDLDLATWTIPAARMKSKRPHRVALSGAALAILEQARPLRNDSDLLFPSALRPRLPMDSATFMRVLRENGLAEKTTVHGFRTSFRTWAAECTDIPGDVCELALAHAVGDATERAYNRSDLLEKRERLMQEWADFLSLQRGA